MKPDPDTSSPQTDPLGSGGGAPGEGMQGGAVVRLLPVAVLIVSPDRYFRAAATMLLSRRGCTVFSAADEREAIARAERHGVDVLVAESAPPADPVAAARALAARIDAASAAAGRRVAPVGVVVVGEPEDLGAALAAGAGAVRPALDKWGPFERLFQAIGDRDRARRLPSEAAGGRRALAPVRPHDAV